MGVDYTAYLVYGIVLVDDIDENNALFDEYGCKGIDEDRFNELYPELDIHSIGLYDEQNCYICVETYSGDYVFKGALPVITDAETAIFKQACKTLGVEEQEPKWHLLCDVS